MSDLNFYTNFALLPQGPSAGVIRRPSVSQSEAVVYLENGLT